MEQVLKAFTIGFLLRSLFAGVFFVIAYQVSANGTMSVVTFDSSALFGVVLPVSLFSGVTIYGLHRAVIYPIFEYILSTSWVRDYRERCPLISDNAINILRRIWDMGAKKGKEAQQRYHKITSWADNTHLQYVSGLCIAGGSVVGLCMTQSGNHEVYWPLASLAIGFMISGFVSDWRLRRLIEKL